MCVAEQDDKDVVSVRLSCGLLPVCARVRLCMTIGLYDVRSVDPFTHPPSFCRRPESWSVAMRGCDVM